MRKPIYHDDSAVRAIIRAAADRHHIPRKVALAFAWLESRFDPNAEGDLGWHERDGGRLYRSRVRDNPRLASNPARLTGECWHSYGLFQLLACYFVMPHEAPAVLLDPLLNAERGCAEIARLWRIADGDVRKVRLKYVGCGFDGLLCRPSLVQTTTERLYEALARFADEDDEGVS